jgi:hypothetical protein
VGKSLGGPETNYNTPIQTQVVVAENGTQVVCFSRATFYYVFQNKMNEIIKDRKKLLIENFNAFNQWNDQKLWIVCELLKTRIMHKDEVLFEDATRADMLYFLVKGKLRIEKNVGIIDESFHPVSR